MQLNSTIAAVITGGASGLGAATAAGGALTGWLYDTSIPALITTMAVIQGIAVAFFAVAISRRAWTITVAAQR